MTRTETWNGLREFVVGAYYFELLSTPTAVDVVLYCKAPGGERVIARESQVSAGWFHLRAVGAALLEPISRVEITNGSSQQVTFLYSDGTSGNRSVPADITDRVGRLLGVIASITADVNIAGTLARIAQKSVNGVNALVQTPWGFVYGAAFASTSALASAANEQVFAAASNTNGATVWAAEAQSIPSATGQTVRIGLQAHTSAPTAYTTGDVLLTLGMSQGSNVGLSTPQSQLFVPTAVPSGKGLWWVNSGSNTEGSFVSRKVLYTLH